MADPRGFLKIRERELPPRRPVAGAHPGLEGGLRGAGRPAQLQRQAGRCMDCGIPFCHHGCPLGNLIPEWNDLVWRGDWSDAIERLHATNNFPEFTGRLCPAPCETACVLGINQPAVTIKQVEVSIDRRGLRRGLVTPLPPERLSGKTVAVVGSGPGGPGRRPAADPRRAHGRRLRAGRQPRRAAALRHPRVQDGEVGPRPPPRRRWRPRAPASAPGVDVGVDITWPQLRARYDAVVLATGATVPRDLPVPGRELGGIHQAMDYLPQAQPRSPPASRSTDQIPPTGKHVVVIGGGDTGADCIGTAHRQGAASVTSSRSAAAGRGAPRAPAVADLPDALSASRAPTRRAASASYSRRARSSSSATTTATSRRCASPRSSTSTAAASRSRAPSARSRPSSCCSRWASRPESRGLVEQLGVELDRARQRRARRRTS